MRLCLIGNPNIAHTRRWVQDLDSLGWEIHLISEHVLRGEIPKNCTFYDLTKLFNMRKLRYLIWGITVRGLVKRIKPQLVHSLGVASAGWLGAAMGFHPFIVSALGSDLMLLDKRSTAHQALSQRVLRQADYVLCVSTPLLQKAAELDVPDQRRQLVYLGVDTEIFKPSNDRLKKRQDLGLPEGPLVLNLRAIQPVYRPLDLAKAIPGVLEQIPEVNFAIFTYNAELVLLAEFQQTIDAAGTSQSVHYIPPLTDDAIIASYFQAADVSVSIPESDGMPASVLEAMACGCVLVASDLPNLHEWIRHKEEGLLVPVGDIPKLTDALIRVLRDDHLRRKLQAQAVQVIQRQGDRKQIIQQVQQIYAKFTN